MKVFNTVKEIHIERQNQRANDVVYTLLGVLIGEIDRMPARSKSSADEIYTCINRMYNSAKEMSQYSIQSKIEMEYLQDYIKQQLTEAELTGIIRGLKEDGYKSIGDFMKALNMEYKGRFDGKVAASIINKILQE